MMSAVNTPRELAPEVAFGTSGLRASVQALSAEVVQAWTCCFLAHMAARHPEGQPDRLLIGWDLRPSSPDMVASACVAASLMGVEPVLAGALPTPALALACMQEGMPGLMVTGSHIPFDMNGIKFYTPEGEISKQDEATMAAWPLAAAWYASQPYADFAGWLAVVKAQSGHASKALQGYRERYLGCFSGDALQGLRVGLYQHSSVARDFLAELLPQLGAEVILIGRSDQFVPIDTEAVSSDDQRQFADWCRDYALDALVSTDGDADRPLLCDGHGNFIPGDQLGMITARYLGIKTVVAPVSCTSALESSGWFSMVQRTRIGSPFVIAAMQALSAVEGAVAGFEANGGFLLGTDIVLGGRVMTALPTRDSLLPILCTLVASRVGGGTLAGCVARLPQRFTRADRIRSVPAAVSMDLLARCADEAASLWRDSFMSGIGRVVQVDQTDGVRMTLEQGGIVHFRASGNAPELRCYVEAGAVAEAEALLAVCMERLRAHVAAV